MASGSNDDPVEVSPCGRFNKYKTLLGSGGFKEVYRGIDSQTGELVAWGESLAKEGDMGDCKIFRNEAAILRQLQHPNILEWRGYFEVKLESEQKLVLLTELMPAGTIRTYIEDQSCIHLSVIRSWCRQVLQGLSFLHSLPQPIIHRDLKCDNFLLKAHDGPVKIGDFGLAITKTGDCLDVVNGTDGFMAPEMYSTIYDEAVDVFAFGMSVVEMATCSYPYMECPNSFYILAKVTAGIMPASFDLIDNDEVREFIQICTKPKAERPTSRDLLKSEFLSHQENAVLKFPDATAIMYLHYQKSQNSRRTTDDALSGDEEQDGKFWIPKAMPFCVHRESKH